MFFSFGGKSVPDLLVALMARDRPTEMQLAVAKCITFLYRAGAISAEDPKILYKTLPVLVSFRSYAIISKLSESFKRHLSGVPLPRTLLLERTSRSSRNVSILDRSKCRITTAGIYFQSFNNCFDFVRQLQRRQFLITC